MDYYQLQTLTQDSQAFIPIPDTCLDTTNTKMFRDAINSYQVPDNIDMSWAQGLDTVDMAPQIGTGKGVASDGVPQGMELSSSLDNMLLEEALVNQDVPFGLLDETAELLEISALQLSSSPQFSNSGTDALLGGLQLPPQSAGYMGDSIPPQTCVQYPQPSNQPGTGHPGVPTLPQTTLSPGGTHTIDLGALQIPQSSPHQGTGHPGVTGLPQAGLSPGGTLTAQLGALQIPQSSPQLGTCNPGVPTLPQAAVSPGGALTAQMGALQIPQCIPQQGQHTVPTLGSLELETTPGTYQTPGDQGAVRSRASTSQPKQSGRKTRQRPPKTKTLKLYEITEKLDDPVEEKKRRDAINSKQNRDKRARQMETLRNEVKDFTDQRDQLQREVLALKQREEILKEQLRGLLKTPSSWSDLTPPPSYPPTPSSPPPPPPYHSTHITLTSAPTPISQHSHPHQLLSQGP